MRCNVSSNGWWQRLGLYTRTAFSCLPEPAWIHAASISNIIIKPDILDQEHTAPVILVLPVLSLICNLSSGNQLRSMGCPDSSKTQKCKTEVACVLLCMCTSLSEFLNVKARPASWFHEQVLSSSALVTELCLLERYKEKEEGFLLAFLSEWLASGPGLASSQYFWFWYFLFPWFKTKKSSQLDNSSFWGSDKY